MSAQVDVDHEELAELRTLLGNVDARRGDWLESLDSAIHLVDSWATRPEPTKLELGDEYVVHPHLVEPGTAAFVRFHQPNAEPTLDEAHLHKRNLQNKVGGGPYTISHRKVSDWTPVEP